MVIGVTDEDPETVDAWFAARKPEHPIARVEMGSKLEAAVLDGGFPSVAVVDPSGNITWSGHSGYEEALEAAAESAKREELYPVMKLSKVLELKQGGDVGKAWAATLKLIDKGDEEVAPWAERVREELLVRAGRDRKTAGEQAQQGLVFQAKTRMEPYAESKVPFPDGEAYQAFLEELEARPDYKQELKASELFAKAEALVKEAEYTDAAKAFASIAKKYEGVPAADLALKEAKSLVSAGRPGYRGRICPSCKELRRACEKHDESGKIRF